MKRNIIVFTLALGAVVCPCMKAQTTLTLDECRKLATESNKELLMAGQKVRIAEYDKKIAAANWYPDISVSGAYFFNSKDMSLMKKTTADQINAVGGNVQNAYNAKINELLSNPILGTIIGQNQHLQQIVQQIASLDIATPLNAIGANIENAFHLDINNVFAGVVSLKQPVFMGGKIAASNKMARLAIELNKAGYDLEYQQVMTEVDQAYWQIVSIAGKKKLAEGFADLLHQMEHEVGVMKAEGILTESDALAIKVKANEADMMLTKATNGLILSKMLLCKICGLPLDSEITLYDEGIEEREYPEALPLRTTDEIFASRPEIRSLDLASQIYDKKIAIARADMMPHIALTANYIISNPNLYNGWQNKFNGMFNVGAMINIPIVHGREAASRKNKAKAEALMVQYQKEDAMEKISLQVEQLRQQEQEAMEKCEMTRDNLANAEENLRIATIGFSEGVVTTNTVLSAQTAWLQAHSAHIDAEVEVQVCHSDRMKAEGLIFMNNDNNKEEK